MLASARSWSPACSPTSELSPLDNKSVNPLGRQTTMGVSPFEGPIVGRLGQINQLKKVLMTQGSYRERRLKVHIEKGE